MAKPEAVAHHEEARPADAASAVGGPPAGSGRRLAFNAAAGGIANLLKIAIQLVMLPLMAHLLGPGEFGLYALVLPTIMFFSSLADGGMGTALAREQEASRVVWSTAFWLLVSTGLVLAVVVLAWGFVLSILSHEPQVRGLMAFMSVCLPLITLTVVPSARLTRHGHLAVIAVADLAANAVGAACAISFALAGFGAWSLAIQYVATFTLRAVILNAAAFVPPGLEFDLSQLRVHLATGSSLISGRLVEFMGRLVENLVYGRVFGAASLGSYAFANQAPKFICEAASGPTWGALYTVALRGDHVRTASVHHKLTHLLMVLLLPMAALVAASAPELLPLILGAKWSPAAPLIQMILPAYALTVVAMQNTALLLAAGHNWLPFWMSVGTVVLRIIAVCAGVWIGPTAVAAGLAGAQVIGAATMLILTANMLGPDYAPPLGDLIAPVLSSLLAGLTCFGLLELHVTSPLWLFVALAAGGVTYGVTLLATDGQRLSDSVRQIRSLIRRA